MLSRNRGRHDARSRFLVYLTDPLDPKIRSGALCASLTRTGDTLQFVCDFLTQLTVADMGLMHLRGIRPSDLYFVVLVCVMWASSKLVARGYPVTRSASLHRQTSVSRRSATTSRSASGRPRHAARVDTVSTGENSIGTGTVAQVASARTRSAHWKVPVVDLTGQWVISSTGPCWV